MRFRFDSFNDFLTMSGHGPYVWASVGIFFASLLILLAITVLRNSSAKKDIVSYCRRMDMTQQTDSGN